MLKSVLHFKLKTELWMPAPNKAAHGPPPTGKSVAKKIMPFSFSDRVQASWAFEHWNPTFHTGRIPGALVLFGFHCWMAKEIVWGQWTHNNPWQVVTAIWNLKSQRRTSSLLSIVTAGASSHSRRGHYYFSKWQEVAIVWFWTSFFSLLFLCPRD